MTVSMPFHAVLREVLSRPPALTHPMVTTVDRVKRGSEKPHAECLATLQQHFGNAPFPVVDASLFCRPGELFGLVLPSIEDFGPVGDLVTADLCELLLPSLRLRDEEDASWAEDLLQEALRVARAYAVGACTLQGVKDMHNKIHGALAFKLHPQCAQLSRAFRTLLNTEKSPSGNSARPEGWPGIKVHVARALVKIEHHKLDTEKATLDVLLKHHQGCM